MTFSTAPRKERLYRRGLSRVCRGERSPFWPAIARVLGLLKKSFSVGFAPPSFRRKPESILTFHRVGRPRLRRCATPEYGIRAEGMAAHNRFHRRMKMDPVEPSLPGRLRHRNDDQKRRAKPPSRIGRRSLGIISLEDFFNNPALVAIDLRYGAYAPTQDEECGRTVEPAPSLSKCRYAG